MTIVHSPRNACQVKNIEPSEGVFSTPPGDVKGAGVLSRILSEQRSVAGTLGNLPSLGAIACTGAVGCGNGWGQSGVVWAALGA